jgi:hypothetical protein
MFPNTGEHDSSRDSCSLLRGNMSHVTIMFPRNCETAHALTSILTLKKLKLKLDWTGFEPGTCGLMSCA